MRLLLDTHTFLWFVLNDSRLSRRAKDTIENTADVFLSAASYWEIAIKVNLGKLQLVEPIDVLVRREMNDNALRILPIELNHVAELSRLPMHHRDPFDRIIIAQAVVENLTLITSDAMVGRYPTKTLW